MGQYSSILNANGPSNVFLVLPQTAEYKIPSKMAYGMV